MFPCDLTNAAEVESLLQHLLRLPNGIDVVVSNAGKSIRRSIFDSLDRRHDFSRTMNLNYFGPVQLLLALIPTLVARKGQVINISAVNVLLASAPKWAAYQASKTAFDQWFRCVGPELDARGVATTSIYLPLVRTRMIEPTKEYSSAPAMQPEQVASLICRAINSRRRSYGPWWLLPAQLVYGIPVLGLPILILLIMLLAKGEAAGFAGIFAFYIACFWAGVIPIAALMLWSLSDVRHGRCWVKSIPFALACFRGSRLAWPNRVAGRVAPPNLHTALL